jgi:hypothetical protein
MEPMGEPDEEDENCCFACGVEKSYKRLEKCHVTPRTLGGKHTVLLCRECHNLAPNTTNQDMFYLWCDKQDNSKRRMDELNQALNDFGATPEKWVLWNKAFKDPGFEDFFNENTQLHGHNSRGTILTYSTVFAALETYSKRLQSE